MGDNMRKFRMGFIRAAALAVTAAGLAAPAMAAKPSSIGITSLVVRDVEGKTEAEIRKLVLQDSVYQNEIVQTGLESASELKFADETRISVGPNSTIVLDEFVYDPDPGEGTFALKVTEGVFRFFSGNMASSNYKIETPTVTVGVRGTVLVMVTRADGAVAVIMESDDGVEVTNNNGDMVLLETPGMATVAFANGDMTPPGDPPAWALWRIHDMDNVLSTAGLPAPPKPEAPDQPEPDVETAAAPPPPPEPAPLETVETPPKRGLPRATYAQTGEYTPGAESVPAGGWNNANEKAKSSDAPGGGDPETTGEGEEGPLFVTGDGGGEGSEVAGNSNNGNNGGSNNGGARGNSGTAGSNGNGNAGGNGNGNGKGNS
jgi:hypothetical protein